MDLEKSWWLHSGNSLNTVFQKTVKVRAFLQDIGGETKEKWAHVDLIFFFPLSFLRKASPVGIMLSEISYRRIFMMTALKFLSDNPNISVFLVLVSIACLFSFSPSSSLPLV